MPELQRVVEEDMKERYALTEVEYKEGNTVKKRRLALRSMDLAKNDKAKTEKLRERAAKNAQESGPDVTNIVEILPIIDGETSTEEDKASTSTPVACSKKKDRREPEEEGGKVQARD